VKKRTAFETALVRRIARKGDFLRYVAYEMQLEALRKRRLARLSVCAPSRPPGIMADLRAARRAAQGPRHGLGLCARPPAVPDLRARAEEVRRGRRALARVHTLRQARGRARARRAPHGKVRRHTPSCVCAPAERGAHRALQLHPNTPALYILAAAHELEHLSPAAARTLLQRGLRLNAESVPLWAEYVKMELGFAESLRRRWAVLGISTGGAAGEAGREQVDTDLDAQAEADLARQEILKGAIAKSAIASAVKGNACRVRM
jgi:U3 small nucleolar RNA-associated protein 6